MHVSLRNVALLLSLLTGPAFAVDSLHTGYWKASTPSGTVIKCRSVQSQAGMVEWLTKAGWPSDRRMPSIDWSRSEVAIVAPDRHYNSADLGFRGLTLVDGKYRLRYGWRSWPEPEVRCDANNICSSSQGLRKQPTDETIVVAFPRRNGGPALVCSNAGLN